MNIDLTGLDDSSKVWIYQSNRKLNAEESLYTIDALNAFASKWTAHSMQLKAKAVLVADQFIILAVDQTLAGASGCSIDASVHFLKSLQSHLGIDLFDRMQFAYLDQAEIKTADRETFAKLYADGLISGDTEVVDTLVKTKKDLSRLIKPLKESWHARMV